MGHDIEIREGGEDGEILTKTYISFNWSGFNDFHISHICGHPGRIIAKYLREILDRMKEDEVLSESDIRVNGYGCLKHEYYEYVTEKYPEEVAKYNAKFNSKYDNPSNIGGISYHIPEFQRDISSKFNQILSYFLQIAEEYPNGYWFSDQTCGSKRLYGHAPVDSFFLSDIESDNDAYSDSDSDDYSNEESDDRQASDRQRPSKERLTLNKVAPIMPHGIYGVRRGDEIEFSMIHPTKGMMMINNYANAMEMHRLEIERKDKFENWEERAKFWYEIAFMLPAV